MLEDIRRLNPDLNIKMIDDESFKTYGRIIRKDVINAIEYVDTNYPNTNSGSEYVVSDEKLEAMAEIKSLGDETYGYLDYTAGVVHGHNNCLNGVEYHQCSELVVAVSDYILAVGHRWDMENDHYDGSKIEIFYIPKGTITESYATTLHYTPIEVSDDGFKTMCFLLKGTGDKCERVGILKKKNKWFIAHPENISKVQLGDLPNLVGKMLVINH